MNKRLTPRTLGLYLGAECEYEWRDSIDSVKWFKGSDKITFETLFRSESGYATLRNIVPILRPLESMTEEEWASLQNNLGRIPIIEKALCSKDDFIKAVYSLPFPQIMYMIKNGFDCGSWVEENVHGKEIKGSDLPVKMGREGEVWKTKWVPSLIDENLAIAKS